MVGTLDTDASQQDLETLAEQVEKRCIVASTCAASGMDLNLTLKKGEVDHNCQPACELHDLEASKNTTGGCGTKYHKVYWFSATIPHPNTLVVVSFVTICVRNSIFQCCICAGTVKGNPGSEGDAPQFDGTRGHGAPSSRGLHTSAWRGRDGEDVARENLQADKTPQLQKGTSDQGAPETAGGAYGSRDSPRAQAAPPTEGKSDEELVKEQTAGAAVPPAKDGNGDGGGAPESLDFAGEEAHFFYFTLRSIPCVL